MSHQSKLRLVQDELGSIQVHVTIRMDDDGVVITAENEADWLIARKEVTRNGFRAVRREAAIFA